MRTYIHTYIHTPITKVGVIEIWWDEAIHTHPKVEKNRPDLVIWVTKVGVIEIW